MLFACTTKDMTSLLNLTWLFSGLIFALLSISSSVFPWLCWVFNVLPFLFGFVIALFYLFSCLASVALASFSLHKNFFLASLQIISLASFSCFATLLLAVFQTCRASFFGFASCNIIFCYRLGLGLIFKRFGCARFIWVILAHLFMVIYSKSLNIKFFLAI